LEPDYQVQGHCIRSPRNPSCEFAHHQKKKRTAQTCANLTKCTNSSKPSTSTWRLRGSDVDRLPQHSPYIVCSSICARRPDNPPTRSTAALFDLRATKHDLAGNGLAIQATAYSPSGSTSSSPLVSYSTTSYFPARASVSRTPSTASDEEPRGASASSSSFGDAASGASASESSFILTADPPLSRAQGGKNSLMRPQDTGVHARVCRHQAQDS